MPPDSFSQDMSLVDMELPMAFANTVISERVPDVSSCKHTAHKFE
jgi:hypothetical protein